MTALNETPSAAAAPPLGAAEAPAAPGIIAQAGATPASAEAVPSDVLPVERADSAETDEEASFDLRAFIAKTRAGIRAAVEAMTVSELAVCIGAASMAIGLAVLPPPIDVGHLMLGVGAVIMVLAMAWSPRVRAPAAVASAADATGLAPDVPETSRVLALVEGLDRKIEHLKDAQWELNESEFRYRDLLDAQDDVILRRDAEGNLTYVNHAFSRVFGLDTEACLGKPFRPIVHEGEAPAAAVFDGVRRTYTQRIETTAGARWFCWDEQIIAAREGAVREFQCAGRDVTAERLAQTQLAEARDAAQAASRAKSRFLAVMSHEIRTPMNGILGMTSLLTETPLTAEQETYTRAIGQSAKTLLSLIDEILDFSKIEAGKIELRRAPFVLDEMVQGVVELLAPRAHEKGLQLAWQIDPALPRAIVGDEARVRQILLNLVGNAIKFTDRGGIVVEAAVGHDGAPAAGDEAAVILTVTDTGIGISREAMTNIFSEFEQAGPIRSRRHAGTGLGLAISRHLAQAMGGTISADSRLGAGSTFALRMSFSKAPQSATFGEALEPLRSAKRVLVVIDQPIEAQVMAATLRQQGCQADVTSLADACDRIAIADARKQPFDVLVVDAGSDPREAGRILSQLRDGQASHGDSASTRAIVTIKATERTKLTDFRREGFTGFLVRPVRPASLLAQISIGGARAETPVGATSDKATGDADRSVRRVAWRPRVLLAEDNEIGALLACAMLDKSGCDVLRVRTGIEAVEAVRSTATGATDKPFDLILMDVHMPDMDGLDATRALRELGAGGAATPSVPPFAVPPIIALTANAFSEDRAQCLEAGMVDHLAKPFVRAELIALIEKWCRPVPLGLGHGAIDDGVTENAA